MTAVVEVNEQYIKRFNQFIESFPKDAIKLTFVKNNLNKEIKKRIAEVKNHNIETNPLRDLSSMRERYVGN